jgi:histidinol phosphatase-like enzyme
MIVGRRPAISSLQKVDRPSQNSPAWSNAKTDQMASLKKIPPSRDFAPDLFLATAERLGVNISASIVVGDSVWDLLAAQRARALGVGLLSGGYGKDELERAGAYRVYEDSADMLEHLDEVGVQREETSNFPRLAGQ